MARLATLTFAVVVLVALVRAMEPVLVPVIISLAFAYLLDPFADRLEARGWSRTQAAGLVFAGVGTLAVVAVAFTVPLLLHQAALAVERLPVGLVLVEERLVPWVEANFDVRVPDRVADYLLLVRDQAPLLVKPLAGAAAELGTKLGAVAASLVNLVLIPVLTFFFLRDFDRMAAFTMEQVPPRFRAPLRDRLVRIDDVVGAWFRGQVEVACLLGLAYGVGLSIVFGLSDLSVGVAMAIGLATGGLNVIPYFGPLLGMALALSHTFLDWVGPGPMVGVVAVFFIVQQIEAYIITPRIIGDRIGLPPVGVILALIAGAQIGGLVGLLLAVPLAGVARTLAPDLLALWRGSDAFGPEVPATDDGSG